MKHIAYSGVGLALAMALTGLPALAQNQSSSQSSSAGTSLGDYARAIRKESGPKTAPKVYDNDDLPKQEHLSIVGQPHPPASEPSSEKKEGEAATPAQGETKAPTEAKPGETKSTGEQKTASTAAATSPAEDEATRQAAAKQWADKIQAQKDQVDLLARELNVLQREYQIRAAAMYADAGNRLRNQADWDKQDAQYKQQIADKQKALDDAKAKLDDMQEQARKAGAPVAAQEAPASAASPQ